MNGIGSNSRYSQYENSLSPVDCGEALQLPKKGLYSEQSPSDLKGRILKIEDQSNMELRPNNVANVVGKIKQQLKASTEPLMDDWDSFFNDLTEEDLRLISEPVSKHVPV